MDHAEDGDDDDAFVYMGGNQEVVHCPCGVNYCSKEECARN